MNAVNELQMLKSASAAAAEAALASHDFCARAAAEGLLDVAVADMDSPLGPLLLAVTPKGLACIAFDNENRDSVLDRLARQLSPRVLVAPAATDEVRRELDEYFGGRRRHFDIGLDRRLMSPFVLRVLTATAGVPFGELATYGQIAARIGRPQAARAVGSALGANPIPIVLPCHRIVSAGGRLTGYAGGLNKKERLLRLEGSLNG